MSDDTFFIEASDVVYYSERDEANFFTWLDGIPCVTHYEGRLSTLTISISGSLLREDDVREILALYQRYEIEMTSLAVLDRPEYSSWFRDERKYWYSKIFRETS